MVHILISVALGILLGNVFTKLFIKKKKTVGKIVSTDEDSFYIELSDKNAITTIKESDIIVLKVTRR